MFPFFETVKKHEESNLNISVDPVFRKLDDKFKLNQTEKTYAKIVAYLRKIVEENKIAISPDYTLVYSDDNCKPIFNSSLKDNKHGNSLENYLSGSIKFDNKGQKKSAQKSMKDILNVTGYKKKNQNYTYVSNFIGTQMTSGQASGSCTNCGGGHFGCIDGTCIG